jgi:translation initiation factor IF-2
MRMRCLWCAVATSALAVAVSGFAGCSEGAKPAPAPVPAPVVSAGEAPSAPAAGGVPKPGKAAPGASASPAAPTGAALAAPAPAAAAPAAPAATAPAVKGPTVKGPPKGKVPAKLQGKTPPAPEPF